MQFELQKKQHFFLVMYSLIVSLHALNYLIIVIIMQLIKIPLKLKLLHCETKTLEEKLALSHRLFIMI